MPDPNSPIVIRISYHPNDSPQITLDQPDVHVPQGTNTIQWVLDDVPSGTTIAFIDNWHPTNPLSVEPNPGNDFTGTDVNDNATQSSQQFTYDVFLLHNCSPVPPRDPEIENDPGTGHFNIHHDSSV